MNKVDEHLLKNCATYAQELGQDYRRLYQLQNENASDDRIREQKAKIRSDKRRLKNTVKQVKHV